MVLSCAGSPVLSDKHESARMGKEWVASRGGATRTLNLRFWRPLLYQLSYTPSSLVIRHFRHWSLESNGTLPSLATSDE
jgi:hypothetical protein